MTDLPDRTPRAVSRPPTARPGGLSPWAALPHNRRQGLTLAAVLAAMERAGLVGPVAGGTGWPEVALPSPSAVLVALFEEAGETRVVLTRRASTLRSHRGEVSFPGGRADSGEAPEVAALREAAEEVALDPAAVRPVGWLRPVQTFGTGSVIVPVVGALDRRPHLVPSPAEVARVFDVALADLAGDGVFHEERWSIPGRPVPGSADGAFPVWFFDVAGETVWGATARVLVDLVSVVLEVPAAG
jgi:8-oxo-dGTP pyrophosphatase MutT (NUDIX family)